MKQILIYILPLLFIFLSCSDERERGTSSTNAKDTQMSFTVSLPAQAQPTTYALTESDENAVNSIYVLVFEDDEGIMKLADWAEAVPGSIQDDEESNKKRFTVNFTRLKKSSVSYQFVIVANAKDQVENIFNASGITVGAIKAPTLSLLKLTSLNRWISDNTDSNYRRIPMWGESALQTVSDNMTISGLKLLRMVAKINVSIGDLAQSKFKLKSVHLYNYYTNGRIVPDAGNLILGSTSKVEKPTISGARTKGPILYDGATTGGNVTDTELLNSIYTFESIVPYYNEENSENADLDKITCLVIGGQYDGSGTTTYYRLDIGNKDTNTGKVKYMNILRNHKYELTITKVSNKGYPTPEEAFKSRAVNIELEIQAWDESDLNDIVFDGQYQMAVSTDNLSFYREGRAQKMDIKTDHPSGWKVEAASKPSWITIMPDNDNSGNSIEASVIAQPLLANAEDRTGVFYILAGNLRKKITVTQKNEMEFTLDVFPETLIFRKSGAQGKPIKVTTYPVGLVHNISSISDNGNDIEWITGPAELTGALCSAENVYTFQPKPNNSGIVRTNVVSIKVVHNGVPLTRTINMRQLATDLLFDITGKLASYPGKGNNYALNIQSDAPWQLLTDATSDPYDPKMLTFSGDPGEHEIAIEPTAFPFSISDNTTFKERIAYIKARSSDIDFPTQDIEIKQGFEPTKLNITTATTVDFGTATTSQIVKLETNTDKWKYTTDANYSNVVNSALPAANTTPQVGSSSALSMVTDQVQFTPITTTTATAGTLYQTTVKFTTINDDGAPETTKDVVLKRTVAGIWTYASVSPATNTTIAQNATAITVKANTNMAWNVGSNLASTVSQTASAYAAGKSLIITIPANNTWSSRSVTVSAIQSGGTLTTRGTYTQPGYTLVYSSTTVPAGNISGDGGTYSFTFNTTTANPVCSLRALSGITTLVTSTIPARTSSGTITPSSSLTIPKGASSARTIIIQYQTATGTWVNIFSRTQDAYDPCGTSGVAKAQAIGANGKSYLTHRYGNSCWMVENSSEFGYAYDKFSDTEINGAYYRYSSKNSACPTGWHLPKEAEVEELRLSIKDDWTGVGKWWYIKASNAFAGYMYSAGGGTRFANHGYWWTGDGNYHTFYNNNSGEFLNDWETWSDYCHTARCVENK